MNICEGCGKDVPISEWPWCPHGKPSGMLGKFAAYFDEHISEKGEYITSLADRKRLMKQNNLDYHGVARGMPGQEF